jgi:uncharacterized iron-regulated membrane protein
MNFKKINAWLHLWLGLGSGIIVFIISITGCILVFEHEIKSFIYPWLHAKGHEGAAQLPPSALHKSVQSAFPDMEINSIWYGGNNKTAKVSLTGSDSSVFVNPYTAEITAIKDHEDFFHIILDGHVWLWLPAEIGHHVTAWGTLIFFLLLISGLILWWPKKWNKANKHKSFKIKWNARFKRLNYDLHNVLGFYSLIIAAIIAFTALIMCFGWLSDSVYWVSSGGESRPPRTRAFTDTTKTYAVVGMDQVDKAWRKGVTELGNYNTSEIIVSFPKKPADAIYVCTDMINGTWRDIYLDQHTLAVLPSSGKSITSLRMADLITRTNYGLHVGAIGGIPTKILYFLASLICASLPVTGFYVWWGKRNKKPIVKVKKSLAL